MKTKIFSVLVAIMAILMVFPEINSQAAAHMTCSDLPVVVAPATRSFATGVINVTQGSSLTVQGWALCPLGYQKYTYVFQDARFAGGNLSLVTRDDVKKVYPDYPVARGYRGTIKIDLPVGSGQYVEIRGWQNNNTYDVIGRYNLNVTAKANNVSPAEAPTYIYKNFLSKKMTKAGAAAVLGNISWESGFISTNLQNSYEKKSGYTDASYTAAVDNGTYSRNKFVNDRYGYGLCQWTAPELKAALYDYAKAKKVSIGDFNMQCEFLLDTLTSDGTAKYKYCSSYGAKTIQNLMNDYLNNKSKNSSGYIDSLCSQFFTVYEGAGDNTLANRQSEARRIFKLLP